jgi:hypothetical protein
MSGPICGSYLQIGADEYVYSQENAGNTVLSQWYNTGVANTVVGSNYRALYSGKNYAGSDIPEDLSDPDCVSQAYSASGLYGKYAASSDFDFRTPTLWQGSPDTYKYFRRLILRCWQEEGVSVASPTYDATLSVSFYDENNILRDTRVVTPPPKSRDATYSVAPGNQNTPEYGTGVRPLEIPIAIRAKGISVRANMAGAATGLVVITDFGLIVDVK